MVIGCQWKVVNVCRRWPKESDWRRSSDAGDQSCLVHFFSVVFFLLCFHLYFVSKHTAAWHCTGRSRPVYRPSFALTLCKHARRLLHLLTTNAASSAESVHHLSAILQSGRRQRFFSYMLQHSTSVWFQRQLHHSIRWACPQVWLYPSMALSRAIITHQLIFLWQPHPIVLHCSRVVFHYCWPWSCLRVAGPISSQHLPLLNKRSLPAIASCLIWLVCVCWWYAVSWTCYPNSFE